MNRDFWVSGLVVLGFSVISGLIGGFIAKLLIR